MGEITKIAWCDHTFNPWIGCTKIGPGCDHCYAESQDSRERWEGKRHWGIGVPRYHTSASNWQLPLRWNKKAAKDRLPHRVFCASLADVFDNEAPNAWRDDLWTLIEATPNLLWLLVTKRIGNVKQFVWPAWIVEGFPSNVRLLITVCNQDEADRDIPKLLALPCKNGISYEPALGSVDWSRWLSIRRSTGLSEWVKDGDRNDLHWVIIGGESAQAGHRARPFDLAWARETIAQCKAAGVPVFCKQLGSTAYEPATPYLNSKTMILAGRRLYFKDRAGSDPSEWPEELRVRQFPR